MRCDRLLRQCAKRSNHAFPSLVCVVLVSSSCTVHERPTTAPTNLDRDIALERARGSTRDGDLENARQVYLALVTRNPSDDEARAGLARIDAWQGEHLRAEKAYRDILGRHPADDDVRAGLFDVLVWDHRWADAERLLDAAPRPDSPILLGRRARLTYFDGDVTRARDLAAQARRKAPQDGDLRALERSLWARSARVTSRVITNSNGAPSLGQVDVSLSQAIHRFRFSFDTEQGSRPTSLTSGWAYGATYGFGANYTFAPGLFLGTEVSFGAPAVVVPEVRIRSLLAKSWRPWLSSNLSYSFRHFRENIDTHGLSPALGFTLRGEVRIDVTYWMTYVRLQDRMDTNVARRFVQAIGLSGGRTVFPWLDVRGGYAHGAEAERSPTVFQLLDLVNDSFYVGLRILPIGFVSIEPLYGLALRGPRNGARQVQHTFELGLVLKQ